MMALLQYSSTKMSIVFESSVDGRYNKSLFLTEKILKPIYGGHPFILLNAARYALNVEHASH